MKAPLVLVAGATATMRRLNSPRFGALVVPGPGNRNIPNHRLEPGRWAMDNGAYSGFLGEAFLHMLRVHCEVPGCLFVSMPDVVGDAAATGLLFRQWIGRTRECTSQPLAYVLQDRQRAGLVPWDDIGAVFVGGSTEFKWSRQARNLCEQALARGKHVHVGRVNGLRTLGMAARMGAHTVDGTHVSRWPDIGSARFLKWLAAIEAQPELALPGLEVA